MNIIDAKLFDHNGKLLTSLKVRDADPWFRICDEDFRDRVDSILCATPPKLWNDRTPELVEMQIAREWNNWLSTFRGAKRIRLAENDTREVLSLASGNHGAEILAIKRTHKLANRSKPFLCDGIPLVVGTTVFGNSYSGFYDQEAVILKAEPTGGDPEKWQDWAYYVAGWRSPTKHFSAWATLDEIGGATAMGRVLVKQPAPDPEVSPYLAHSESELISHFAAHPERLATIKPGDFERLVEEIFRNNGFLTERIGAWNQADGGIDILAVERGGPAGVRRLAIQCKVSAKTISARPIRELAGVLDGVHADSGVVATTSSFTKSARREVEATLWRVKLQERDDIIKSIIALAQPVFLKYINEANK